MFSCSKNEANYPLCPHMLLLAKEEMGQSVNNFVHFSIHSYAVACKWTKSKQHSFFLCCQDYNCRNSKFSIACKTASSVIACEHCMIWANSPLILKDFLVLHGKLLYIETFLLIDHFYISLPLFPLLLLSGANMLIQDSSQGSCLLAQTNSRGRTMTLNTFLTKIILPDLLE